MRKWPEWHKVMIGFLAVFCIYAAIKNPEGAADVVKSVFGFAAAFFMAIADFFDALLGR